MLRHRTLQTSGLLCLHILLEKIHSLPWVPLSTKFWWLPKKVTLHNLILTIRPIIPPVSRHLLPCVSQTLKLSKTLAWKAGISLAQLFPTDLLFLSTSLSLVKGCITIEWSRLEISESHLLPSLLRYALCSIVLPSKQLPWIIFTARAPDLLKTLTCSWFLPL